MIRKWKQIEQNLKRKRNPDELVRDILEEQRRKKEAWVETKKAEWADRRSRSRANSTSAFRNSTDRPFHDSESRVLASEGHAAEARRRAQTIEPSHSDELHLNEAIRQSVQNTSTGDAADDVEFERDMRASMGATLERQRTSRTVRQPARRRRRGSGADRSSARGSSCSATSWAPCWRSPPTLLPSLGSSQVRPAGGASSTSPVTPRPSARSWAPRTDGSSRPRPTRSCGRRSVTGC